MEHKKSGRKGEGCCNSKPVVLATPGIAAVKEVPSPIIVASPSDGELVSGEATVLELLEGADAGELSSSPSRLQRLSRNLACWKQWVMVSVVTSFQASDINPMASITDTFLAFGKLNCIN
jgi:hypothetical protein